MIDGIGRNGHEGGGGGTLYEECLFIKFYINALFANIPA